jgi:hypothetical protein
MRVKKHKGKVFGAVMTAAEKEAMRIEINRQILEHDKQYAADMDAMTLYTLMAHYGWKKKRLKKFWDAFNAEHKALREHYQMNGVGDNEWLAHQKLKEIGVDIHQWYKEDESNED